MAGLTDDIAFYEEHRSQLEADHFGLWILIEKRNVVALFTEFEAAAEVAVKKFGRGPFLIRQVGASATPTPASLLYRPFDAHCSVRV